MRTPGQNGSREHVFRSLKNERIFLEEVEHALDLVALAEDYRIEYDILYPHKAIARNRTHEVHTSFIDPLVPDSPKPQNLPAT